jgi:hypothetical protein
MRRMIWNDFKFSVGLAIVALGCAGVASVGIRDYRESQPPDPQPINFLAERNILGALTIRRAGRYLLDIEFDANLHLRSKLCSPQPGPLESGQCIIPANALDIQWRVTDGERVVAEGNLRRQGGMLYFGVFDSIELGIFELPKTDTLAFSIWLKPNLAWMNEGYPRLRIWRDPNTRGDAKSQGTPITTNAFFATFFFTFLLILVLPLEYALRKKRNRSSL